MTSQGPQPRDLTPESNIPRAQHKRKTGLVKIRIGTMHQISAKQRRVTGASVTVLDLGQYPDAKCVVRCLSCARDYKTEKELIAQHPTAKVMREQRETHVWGWWSDDKEDPDLADSPILGLLSDLGQPTEE